MSQEQNVQALLRLLTGPARIPLASALPKVKLLLEAGLITCETIVDARLDKLQEVFPEEKMRKAVLSACKRAGGVKSTTKRTAQEPLSLSSSPSSSSSSSSSSSFPTPKRARRGAIAPPDSTALALPEPATDDEEILAATVIVVNRAPLLLAFALVAIEYTIPTQSESCRLSLAGGVVAANSLSKARSIGITSGQQGIEEQKLFGGSAGQPSLKILGRDIKCLRRYTGTETCERNVGGGNSNREEPQYWALNLEELSQPTPSANIPIHTPESSLSYLNRAFTFATTTPSSSSATATSTQSSRRKTHPSSSISSSLPLVLGALHLLFRSWKDHLTSDQLDQRAWQWYCNVRPKVPQGPSGWGARGEVNLANILALRRRA